METTPNPSCACGCGNEVSRPWHKYYHGHYGRRLTAHQEDLAKRLLGDGLSQRKIAKMLGTSQSTICQISWAIRPRTWRVFFEPKESAPQQPQAVLRKEELEQIEEEQKERMEWRSAKATMKQIREWLRENSPVCR